MGEQIARVSGGVKGVQNFRVSLEILIISLLLAGGAGAQTGISACGDITTPGEYVLEGSIIDSTASSCINITSSDVIFDGASYTIDGLGTSNTHGVYVYNSTIALTNVTVRNLTVTDWNTGINYSSVSNGNITGNNVSYNVRVGIRLNSSHNNTLSGNIASGNGWDGFRLEYSGNNTLSSNNVSYNTGVGIVLWSSGNNTIYNNNFTNTNNAWDDGTNTWNITKTAGTNIINGTWLGGNYWSDYTGSDTDGDGLGNTLLPYTSSGNIISGGDYNPLVPPFISGYKINDTNGNGVWDAGEAGISGWTITLLNEFDVEITNNVTGTDGFYQFTNLANGNYHVREETRPGWNHTNASTVAVVILNQAVMNLNFTNKDIVPPDAANASANPGEILLDEPTNADYIHMSTRLNATVTDNSDGFNVTVNLSSIGGGPAQPMSNIGGDVYSVITNATTGEGNQSLTINATDVSGNSNTSVTIQLKVTRNGDVNEDKTADIADAMWLAKNRVGVPGYSIYPLATDVNGDGIIDIADAMYLAKHLVSLPTFEKFY